MSIRRDVERVHRGELTFDRFVRDHAADWQRMATMILNRWHLPAAIEREDLEQELRLGVWHGLNTWEPGRQPLAPFVVWTAMSRAKKWMNRQRNALRRDDKNPGRFPFAESNVLAEREEDEGLEVAVDAEQEDATITRDLFTQVILELDEIDRCCLYALVHMGGDVDGAARLIYADAWLSVRLRLRTEESARRLIATAVEHALAAP